MTEKGHHSIGNNREGGEVIQEHIGTLFSPLPALIAPTPTILHALFTWRYFGDSTDFTANRMSYV